MPVARSTTLLARPEFREALASLAGRISAEEMRRMNYEVDVGRRDAAVVAAEFVRREFDPVHP